MFDEPEQLTWETLVIYLQQRIDSTTKVLDELLIYEAEDGDPSNGKNKECLSDLS